MAGRRELIQPFFQLLNAWGSFSPPIEVALDAKPYHSCDIPKRPHARAERNRRSREPLQRSGGERCRLLRGAGSRGARDFACLPGVDPRKISAVPSRQGGRDRRRGGEHHLSLRGWRGGSAPRRTGKKLGGDAQGTI